MAKKYNQGTAYAGAVRFSKAATTEPEHSRLVTDPEVITTLNGGDIVPVYYRELVPGQTVKEEFDFTLRQNTILTPTMGRLEVRFYAFFVPNRIVNESWVNVMGENSVGSWTSPQIDLAPLVSLSSASNSYKVPPQSVADYYGFPTQQNIPGVILNQCNDLKFRGYLAIYNEYFRDQNYQPPIPFSRLNVFEGFFETAGTRIGAGSVAPMDSTTIINRSGGSSGSYYTGAVIKAVYGEGTTNNDLLGGSNDMRISNRVVAWSALDKPLKANKLHDQFTSVLPSPQKGVEAFAPLVGVDDPVRVYPIAGLSMPGLGLESLPGFGRMKYGLNLAADGAGEVVGELMPPDDLTSGNVQFSRNQADSYYPLTPVNLGIVTSALADKINLSVTELRQAAAIQQVFEQQARAGSRYREIVRSFFGLEVDDPYKDIPCFIGRADRALDLYQTAQTSASESGGSPQGNLAAFGYTSSHVEFPSYLAYEHGYLHVFAVIRHRNSYASMLARDNFKTQMLDFYLPQLANLSEQPLYTRELNPFTSSPEQVAGYQEAFYEYRYEPDRVTGYMRPGVSGDLSVWNYADPLDPDFSIVNGEWLKSNTEEVVNRTLAVTSEIAPQFRLQMSFKNTNEFPGPTYSVPGMDYI